ncbi:MAG: phospholipase, partial [Candidatus Eremiobacteraeota bacterium]|nr:phospholipase [Candidatus Eremiobacteraeota bacterium]
MRRISAFLGSLAAVAIAAVMTARLTDHKTAPAFAADAGIHKIKHVIVIMQENRSFDSYFGTYPGADGIPPSACIPAPRGGCVRPYHDSNDRNSGG